ncbi:MAG: response regulator, partial [Proteobacteria bacterium]|nr:response regulator [Pseudomonadota bacterium]
GEFSKRLIQLIDGLEGRVNALSVSTLRLGHLLGLKELLKGLGYSVETRASSLDAYEAFRANPEKYDLVVSDMTMPKLTGEQLAMKIQEIDPDLPIILCTGFSSRLNTEELEKVGVKKILMKPITLMELAVAVRTVLDEPRSIKS